MLVSASDSVTSDSVVESRVDGDSLTVSAAVLLTVVVMSEAFVVVGSSGSTGASETVVG